MNTYVTKENEGTLWVDNLSVVGRGKIKIKGTEVQAAVVQSNDREGNKKYELMLSTGLIYFNSPDKKASDKSPDYSGSVSIAGEKMKVSIWDNTSERGTHYYSVKLKTSEDPEIPF